MIYEELAPHHFAEWGYPQPDPDTVLGFAARVDGRLAAICSVWTDGSRFWVSFQRNDLCSPMVHRKVLQLRNALRDGGVDALWAVCDDRIPGARMWLERGGFRPVGGVWRLELA